MTASGREAGAELIESRRLMEEYAADPDPAHAIARPGELGGTPVLEILPSGAESAVTVLHLHGGAYRRGSPRVFAPQLASIAKALGIGRLIAVKYRLAPEHPYPSGLEDALAAYRGLLETTPPDEIVVWGDSAGGGLAAALLLRIVREGLPTPRGAVLISPWADLRVTAGSYEENAATDALFTRASAQEAAEEYLAGQDPSDPGISAVFGDWTGQPPVIVLASRAEVLRDDALALAARAADAGAAVRLEFFDDVAHIWPIMDYPRTDDAVRAVETIRGFLTSELGLADLLDPASVAG